MTRRPTVLAAVATCLVVGACGLYQPTAKTTGPAATAPSTAVSPTPAVTLTPSPQTGAASAVVNKMAFFGAGGWAEEDGETGFPPSTAEAIYHSTDGGVSWTDVTPPRCAGCGVMGVVFGNAVAAASVDGPLGGGAGVPVDVQVEMTRNGGETWTETPLASDMAVVGAQGSFAPNALDGMLALQGWHGGAAGPEEIWATSDGGQHWSEALQQIPPTGPYQGPYGGVTVVSATEAFAAAGYAGGGELERSRDGGRTWQPVSLPAPGTASVTMSATDGPPQFFDSQDGVWLAGEADANPTGPTVVMYRTTDGGVTWQPGAPIDDAGLANYGVGPSWASAAPAEAAVIIGAHVWVTFNDGQTWSEPDTTLTASASVVGINPTGPLYASASTVSSVCTPTKESSCPSSEELLESTDGGASWANVPGLDG